MTNMVSPTESPATGMGGGISSVFIITFQMDDISTFYLENILIKNNCVIDTSLDKRRTPVLLTSLEHYYAHMLGTYWRPPFNV